MDATLLTLGILLMLVGLIGQVKAKEIEVGTENPVVRVILLVIGVGFIYLALSKDYLPGSGRATQVPPTSSAGEPTSGPPVSSGNPTSPPPTSPPAASTTGCVVTISNPLVSLMSEPDTFSQELVRVGPGEYATSDYTVTTFASQEQGWFQIEAEGRTGWIRNDTWTIAEKTSACP